MEGRLHRRVLVPVVLAAAAVGIGAVVVVGAFRGADPVGARPTPAPSAAASAGPSAEACTPRFERFPDDAARAAWFTLDTLDDPNGVVIGNVVRVSRGGNGAITALELPPEAWADGPYDEGALVGADDGLTSTLRFLAPRGCGRTILATSDTVLWRATISPDGQTLYTFHLARGSREPLGLWAAPLTDPTQRQQLLGPVPPDERFGVTWGTSLKWSAEGDRLLVQSCTPLGCRFQIVDPATGAEVFIDDDRLGEAVGLAGDTLFLYGDCPDFRPCRLFGRSVATGAARELHPAIYDAWLVTVGGRSQLLATDWDGERERVNLIDPETGESRLLTVPRGLGPVRNNDFGSVGMPPGWVALSPDGEVPRANSSKKLLAIDIETSRLVTLRGGD
jgi:hypothetical protein